MDTSYHAQLVPAGRHRQTVTVSVSAELSVYSWRATLLITLAAHLAYQLVPFMRLSGTRCNLGMCDYVNNLRGCDKLRALKVFATRCGNCYRVTISVM